MSAELDILEPPPAPVYFCPGESVAVSQAVHRARLAAQWPGCRHCPSRDSTLQTTDDGWRTQIRQTAWGVRGPWQNALTRHAAARLTSVVTAYLMSLQAEEDLLQDDDLPADEVTATTGLSIVVGYDGRPSSPDIYAGIVSAILQNGCDVIDGGRCTAASLQELCRAVPNAPFSMLVTGAGETASVTGFDLFNTDGQAVSIPWQTWGVKVRRSFDSCESNAMPAFNDGRDAATRLRQLMVTDDLSPYPEARNDQRLSKATTTLELPTTEHGQPSLNRSRRCSGHCRSVSAEQGYQKWIKRWFPRSTDSRPAGIGLDPRSVERLRSVFDDMHCPGDVIIGSTTADQSEQLSQRVRDIQAPWGFCIGEDDRYVTLANQYGQCLSASQLSDWINKSIQDVRSHVTTHVPVNEERVVILDAARPHHSAPHEMISDATALIGCVFQIMATGKTLPRVSRT